MRLLSMKPGLLLVFEKDRDVRAAIEEAVRSERLAVVSVDSIVEARAVLRRTLVSGVLLDVMLEEDEGDLLEELSLQPMPPPVIVLSGDLDARAIASWYGVAFLRKPFDVDQLVAAVHVMLDGYTRPARGRGPRPSIVRR